jgi:hypothetical protein
MSDQFDIIPIQPEPKRDRYGRYLLPDPDGGKKELAWTRATTFAKTISDTFALTQWGERMTAKGIGLRPDLYALACSAPVDDKDTLNKVAQQAKDAAQAAAGANLGTALHSFTEALDRGEQPVVPEPWAGDVRAYEQAMRSARLVVAPYLIERIVVVPQFRVAGCFDRILWRDALTTGQPGIVGDLKTAKRVDYSWTEIAIQLALYAHGAAIWDAVTETYLPMPEVDQDSAVVMHLPVGKGRCDLYTVNIAAGWDITETCQAVRTWRSRKDLAQPYGADPLQPLRRQAATNTLADRVREAGTVADLETLWAQASAAGTWTSALTAAARARKEKLLADAAR